VYGKPGARSIGFSVDGLRRGWDGEKVSGRTDRGSPQSSEEAAGPGWLLRKYREEAGLTQRALHEALVRRGYYVSETAVSMWETGERLPSDPVVFHHLGECLSLREDQETALVLAWVVERVFRHLEPYLALNPKLGLETEQLLASLFGSLPNRA
jgi:transcriptional regulator with XRE-family HTH domain